MSLAVVGRNGRVYVRKFDWDEAARLYRDGLSGAEIAARLGVTHKAVYVALERLGVEMRAKVAPSVRESELRCATCREWKPDEAFSLSRTVTPARRGRHRTCSTCATAVRRDYRNRHKIPCDRCGAPRLPQSEKNGGTRAATVRDTGLCITCYRDERTAA